MTSGDDLLITHVACCHFTFIKVRYLSLINVITHGLIGLSILLIRYEVVQLDLVLVCLYSLYVFLLVSPSLVNDLSTFMITENHA
jgi:hypothetical protein